MPKQPEGSHFQAVLWRHAGKHIQVKMEHMLASSTNKEKVVEMEITSANENFVCNFFTFDVLKF